MGSEAHHHHHHHQFHVFFFPLMAHGHMIPTIDIARLFAARGVKATIVTTPLNASLFSTTVERERCSGHDISIQIIQFPATETGLQEGCESLHSLPSKEMFGDFFKALPLLQQPLEQLLVEHHPDFIVADMFFPWATAIAAKLGIPRIVFHGTSFFSLCALHLIQDSTSTNISSDQEDLVVLDFPDKIEMKKSQLGTGGGLDELFHEIRESELRSYGVLVNSFYELEPAYAECYRKVVGMKAWHIGPVSLTSNRNRIYEVKRGQKSNVDESYYLSWLDQMKPNAVLYVSFGSLSQFNTAQLLEIGMALEASGFPFIWVIRTSKEDEQLKFLPEAFEEKIKGRGLIIKDWAPQLLILNHPAIGGFMTHCGWNSIIEGVSAGVPLITWPLFAEQFFNEKLVIQLLRVGIQVGAEECITRSESSDAFVKKERIEKAVNQLMGSGEEAEEIRKRAKEMGQKAKKTVEEGGSSYSDFTAMIEELSAYKQKQPSYVA